MSDIRSHTALHVLKGAVQKVLGAKWTAGTFNKETHGRLTVKFNRKPTDEELRRIEDEANSKIEENQTIEQMVLDRAEAEKRWGDMIYDLFPIPPTITKLRIVHIEGWNVNACKEEHTKTTGEIGRIRLGKARFRHSKQLLELRFSLI